MQTFRMGFFDRFFGGGDRSDVCDPFGPIVAIVRQADLSVVDGLRSAGKKVERLAHGTDRLLDRIADLRPSALVIGIECEQREQNGFLIVKAIKKDAGFNLVPVVVFSVLAVQETFDMHMKLRTAADGYVLGNDAQMIADALASFGR